MGTARVIYNEFSRTFWYNIPQITQRVSYYAERRKVIKVMRNTDTAKMIESEFIDIIICKKKFICFTLMASFRRYNTLLRYLYF